MNRVNVFFVDTNFTDETSTMPTANASEVKQKLDKIIYTLEPCDKVATLYVMQQTFEPLKHTDSK